MSMPPPGQPQPNPTQGSSSPQAREARRIVGVTEYASDAQFVGAHAVQGRDALVAAARARLERVIAAHGAQSREAAVVDFELKSALSRLLPAAAAASPASQVNAPAAPKPPASVASVETAAGKAPAPAARPALRGTRKVDLALALYALRPAIGRAMLGARMRAGSPAHPQPAAIVPQATPAPSQSLESISTSTGQVGEQMQPSLRLRRRSRVRAIAVTVAVLSALGLVIEVAYVPFHLQRLRAAQAPAGGDAGGQSANGSKETPAGQPAPGDQRQLSPSAASASQGTAANAGPTGQASAAQPGSAAPAQGDAPAQVPPSGGSASTAGRSIPAPVIPFDATSDAGLPAAPVPEQVDPALRERRDMLAARWAASVEASLEATRAAGAMRPGMPRWLAEARLLERMVALDDVAQMLIDVRLDDAASLIEVVPARFALEEPAARDSERAPAREDGRLAGDLSRAGGGGEARLAVLRAYRSIPVPPGRTDARTLVSEAIGGPSRNARAIALAILLERGADSAEVLEAMHARAQDLLNAPAIRPVMLQLVGLQPGDVTQDPQELRALLARRILQLRGGPHERLDAVARSMEATLERMARRADPQAAPADMESSIATLARAASRDAGPPRTDAAAGPLQRLAASLESLLRARVTRNHRRIPGERAVVDAAAEISAERAMRAAGALEQSIALAAGILSQDAILLNLRPAWIGDAASRDAAAAAASAPPGTTGTGAAAAAGDGTADPLMWPLPTDATLSRWPRAQAALAQEGGDAAQLMRMAEDIEDSSASPEERALAARLYARAGLAGDEAMAASAARAIAALVPAHAPDAGAQRHRWESIAAQYAAAASLARGRARSSARLPVAASFEADLSARRALADALAMCIAGQGRAALERLQSPAARALAQRLSAALPGGLDGLESLCASRIQQGAPMDRSAMEALLAMEAALRDPRSRRWSDDLALRQDAPLISIDSASAAERARIFGARE